MKTYEMVSLADRNGKIYRAQDMHYQREEGFYGIYGKEHKEWKPDAWSHESDGLNRFIHADGWEEINGSNENRLIDFGTF